MSFDEQPDGDPHGECAAEIHRLEAALREAQADSMLKAVADACQRAEAGWKQECDDADAILVTIALDPAIYRTAGGSLNVPKIRAAVGERQAQVIRDGIAYRDELTRIGNAEAALAHAAAEKAEAERDALRALLREWKEEVGYASHTVTGYTNYHGEQDVAVCDLCQGAEDEHTPDCLFSRIDAALDRAREGRA